MIELLAFALAGILLGIFTGIAPGIHLNTVSLIAVSLAVSGDFGVAVLIACLSITHCFVDFIPSIFLGASDSAQDCVSVLPGHKLFLQGSALEAVLLSCFGCLFGVLFSVSFAWAFVNFAFFFWDWVVFAIPFILLAVLALLVLEEKSLRGKLSAILVILLSGVLGFFCLDFFPFSNSLLALACGFFAASTLLWSLKEKTVPVNQSLSKPAIAGKSSAIAGVLGGVAGSLVSLLPSIGPSEAALIVRKFFSKFSERQYLVLIGAVSSSNTIFGFFMLFYFSKTRNGSAVALSQLLKLLPSEFHILLAFCIFAAGLSFVISIWLSRKAAGFISRVNYSGLNFAVFAFLSILVFFFSGFFGILVFFTASSIGFFALSSGARRSACMAFLMVPTLLFYLQVL